jgi:hypothetical protein
VCTPPLPLPLLLLLLLLLLPELSKLRADNLELAASLQVRPAKENL